MIRKILKYPNPILRKKCQEVREITEEIKNLAWDMVKTMERNKGIGLAASQIGELKRIIIAQIGKKPQIFINPKIIKKSKESLLAQEGCLSFPGLFLKIKRAKEVEIEALNEEGKVGKIKTEGLPARIFQHEIDHLDGILFIDRISFWQRLKIGKKLKNFKLRDDFN